MDGLARLWRIDGLAVLCGIGTALTIQLGSVVARADTTKSASSESPASSSAAAVNDPASSAQAVSSGINAVPSASRADVGRAPSPRSSGLASPARTGSTISQVTTPSVRAGSSSTGSRTASPPVPENAPANSMNSAMPSADTPAALTRSTAPAVDSSARMAWKVAPRVDNRTRSGPQTIATVVIDQQSRSGRPSNDVTPQTTPSAQAVSEVTPLAEPARDEGAVSQPAMVSEDGLRRQITGTTVEPKVTNPVMTVVDAVSGIVSTVFGPLGATTLPDAPAQAPVEWTLLAFARRELGQSAPDASMAVDVAGSPTPSRLAADTLAASTPEVSELAAKTQPVVSSVPVDSQYTGEPTLITQLETIVLRVVDFVLKPIGGLLALTGTQSPIFTDGIPPWFLTLGLNVQQTQFDGMPVWTLLPQSPSGQYVVAVHGGAYVAQISLFHWWTYADMARDTGATIVVPLYPLAPEGTAGTVVPETADFISDVIDEHGASNVSVLGDSAGGGIALAAVQELVSRGLPTPRRMVLLSPWLDATVSDPASQTIDPYDPSLDVPHLQQDGRLWAGDLDPSDPVVSPLFGSLAGLPPTAVFSGSLDLLTPETLDLQRWAADEGLTNFTFVLRNGLIHDWAIFPFIPEAITVRPQIYQGLLGGVGVLQ